MSYYPSSFSIKGGAQLKVVGLALSLASMILASVGIFTHQNNLNLLVSVLVGLFGLRVFVLWIGTKHSSSGHKLSVATPLSRQTKSLLETAQEPARRTQLAPPVQPTYAAPISYASSAPSYTPTAAYPPLPAHASPPFYGRDIQPASTGAAASSSSYIPIEKDAIFELDRPSAKERCFMLPKEGEALVECQDSYALHAEHCCYAVADGVAGSFVPGPWARIIAKDFVERAGKFTGQHDFQNWLVDCSKQWHTWIEERWVPTMNVLRERNGERHGDWSNDIRQGAQTTLIGCYLLSSSAPEDVSTSVSVFAIGDGEFFLFSPNKKGEWEMVEAFPHYDPAQFGSHPDTLVTAARADLLERAWMQRKTARFNAFPGDLVVLASDTLAKWLLTQAQQHTRKYIPLLTCTNLDEFERRIRHELHDDHIEDDDLTMLIIPIA
jgi:hypothetical protein